MHKKTKLLLALALIHGAGAALSAQPLLTPGQLQPLLRQADVRLIDIRDPKSFEAGHIPGALSIPEESISSALAEKLKKMGKPIATYCS